MLSLSSTHWRADLLGPKTMAEALDDIVGAPEALKENTRKSLQVLSEKLVIEKEEANFLKGEIDSRSPGISSCTKKLSDYSKDLGSLMEQLARVMHYQAVSIALPAWLTELFNSKFDVSPTWIVRVSRGSEFNENNSL